MYEMADFVVAGGGSAGCVLAHRLSEDPNVKVILLEAGGAGDRFWVNLPAGLVRGMANTDINWLYSTEPDPTLNGRTMVWHAGRLLGGGSSLNGMVYVRGARYDYDGWANAGCTGWSWNEVLPYFLRAETFEGGRSQAHGSTGPLGVAPPRVMHPLATAFINACAETGMRRIDDYCDGDIDGASEILLTQRRGQRSSTATSYLKQAMRRRNLHVVTGALVDRVLIEGHRAVAVAYYKNGVRHVVRAHREVVVSAGAIQSPAILLRSGIGPAAELRQHGIDVCFDAPEVGKNLNEHAGIFSSRLVDAPTYNAIRNPIRLAAEGLNYLFFRRGMLTTGAVHALAHARSDPHMAHPDLKLQMSPFAFDSVTNQPSNKFGIMIGVNPMFPKSRGEIRLRSTNPSDKPVIDYQMLAAEDDMVVLRKGMRLIDEIYEAPALAKHVLGRLMPPKPLDDAELDDFIRTRARPSAHPVSSCRMGGDAASVVDPQLKVRGLDGLRVIDASIMPAMPSANTNGPTIMIAEKGAEMIRSSTSR